MTQIGIMIDRRNQHGTEYIYCRVVLRDDGQDYPHNPSSISFNGHASLSDLCLRGYAHVPSYDRDRAPEFFDGEPAYRDIYTVDLRTAESMVKTLRKCQARIRKDDAREPGDIYRSFAAAIGATFTCYRTSQYDRSTYAENEWAFRSIPEGVNYYRNRIADMLKEANPGVL